MRLKTLLGGTTYQFNSVKEVLAKANEKKSGDEMAGLAASSVSERIAAKEVLSNLLVKDIRNNPVVPYEEDEVTRIIQDNCCDIMYNRIKNWSMAELREYIVLFIIIEHILFIGRLVLTILSSLPAVKLHVGYIPVTYTMPKIL